MDQQSSLIERFLRYVKIDTKSDEESGKHPSTDKQRDLAGLLVTELIDLGLEVDYDEQNCYVYAYLPPKDSDTDIGFIAHMDTSPAVSGKDVKPYIIHSYDGHDEYWILLNFPN